MNLLSVIERSHLLDEVSLTLDAKRCVRAGNRFSKCDKCVSSCPVQAIRFESTVLLDSAKCVHCGLCLRICPTNAFSGKDGVSDLLECVGKIGTRDVIELACALHPVPQQGPIEANAVICAKGCLAALGASTYLRLLTSGTEKVIVRLDACAGCALSKTLPQIEQTLATVRDLLGLDKIVVLKTWQSKSEPVRSVYQAKNPPVSRREMFNVFSRESKRWATQVIANQAHPSVDAKTLTHERQRFIEALGQWPLLPNPAMELSYPDYHFARLAADDKCTACGTCARICPTHALRFTADRDSYRLTFLTSACVDCGACTSVCKSGALYRNGSPALAELTRPEPILLHEGLLRVCVSCGAKFAKVGEASLCPICDVRRQKQIIGQTLPTMKKNVPQLNDSM